jgi:predicted MPP superfamily phosphohydrolase
VPVGPSQKHLRAQSLALRNDGSRASGPLEHSLLVEGPSTPGVTSGQAEKFTRAQSNRPLSRGRVAMTVSDVARIAGAVAVVAAFRAKAEKYLVALRAHNRGQPIPQPEPSQLTAVETEQLESLVMELSQAILGAPPTTQQWQMLRDFCRPHDQGNFAHYNLANENYYQWIVHWTEVTTTFLKYLDVVARASSLSPSSAMTSNSEGTPRNDVRRSPNEKWLEKGRSARPLRILHISDLHERAAFEGMPEERLPRLEVDAEERGRVLGRELTKAIGELRGPGIDIVCFTGDLTDWGHPAEYAAAAARLGRILDVAGVPRKRFFAVPGNHDVQRNVHAAAWRGLREWQSRSRETRALGRWFRGASGAPLGVQTEWREQILERTAAFWHWMGAFDRAELCPKAPRYLGYRSTIPAGSFEHVPVPIQIVGLDSAWLCGDDHDQGNIVVTDEQVQAHTRAGEHALTGVRIGLIHHPLDHLADHHDARRLLGDDGVDLLLHGHQHTPLALLQNEPGAALRILASGCLMEGDFGKNWPNGFQVIELDYASKGLSVHFRKWSQPGRFWAIGSDIYRSASDGVLRLSATNESIEVEAPVAMQVLRDLGDRLNVLQRRYISLLTGASDDNLDRDIGRWVVRLRKVLTSHVGGARAASFDQFMADAAVTFPGTPEELIGFMLEPFDRYYDDLMEDIDVHGLEGASALSYSFAGFKPTRYQPRPEESRGAQSDQSTTDQTAHEVRLVIAWPIWAGGYPKQEDVVALISENRHSIESQLVRFVHSLIDSTAVVSEIAYTANGYVEMAGLLPRELMANSVVITFTVLVPRNPSARPAPATLGAALAGVVREFCLRSIPETQRGANAFEVSGSWLPRSRAAR